MALVLLLGAGCTEAPVERDDVGMVEDIADSHEDVDLEQPSEDMETDPDLSTPGEAEVNWEDTIEGELQEALAEKYGKTIDQITVKIGLAKENKFVRGEVGIENPDAPAGVEGGIFYAVRHAISGDWVIVHDGNGVIPCEPLELADFPADMMGGCVNE